MRYRIDYGELLALLGDMFTTFTRRDMGWVLAGYRSVNRRHDTYRILRKLTEQELVDRRGRRTAAQFVLSTAGQQRLQERRPATHWNLAWDGRWRAITYDLPEVRRKERRALWAALRARRLGFLQQSVWIWPHPLEAALQQIIRAEGVPGCFCGFDADRLFLCSHAEIVAAAWDWEEINQHHQTYLNNSKVTPSQIRVAADLPAWGRLLQQERSAYRYAFALDPLLPRALWPGNYGGAVVERQHAEFVLAAQLRCRQLATG